MASNILDAFSQLTREKSFDKSEVLELVKVGMLAAVRRKYGPEANADILVDPASGEINIYLLKEVVPTEEDVEDPSIQISVADAKELPYVNEPWGEDDPEPGQYAEIPLDYKTFGRNAIQAAKQQIIQKVREEERARVREEYADRVGELVSGTVQQVDRGNALVFLDRQTEALLPAREQVRREYLRQGETVRALLLDIRDSTKGPQLILSRAHPDFVRALFALEVPEVFQGIVEIREIAREAGSRSKIAVWSRDHHVDPVGACVGLKGSRVQAVVSELGGERIDIVPWSDEPKQFIEQALSPAQVYKIILHEREEEAEDIFGEQFRAFKAKPRFRGPTAAPAPFQPASPEETEAALEESRRHREEAERREAEREQEEEPLEEIALEEGATVGKAEAEAAAEPEVAEEAEAVEEEEEEAGEPALEAEPEPEPEPEVEEAEEPDAEEEAGEPAPTPRVEEEDEKRATVVCAEDQLSLAIGRSGQNVRLASKLTGYKIDLISKQEYLAKEEEILFGRRAEAAEAAPADEAEVAVAAEDFPLTELPGIPEDTLEALSEAGYETFDDIIDLEREDLAVIEGVDEESAALLMRYIEELTVEVEEEWEEEPELVEEEDEEEGEEPEPVAAEVAEGPREEELADVEEEEERPEA
ncbi:MAG: transcription termination factor NusA [Gemmatimonadota bacterium]|nr:transcription termination factor NusA [Gemmatimonadota bacterium]